MAVGGLRSTEELILLSLLDHPKSGAGIITIVAPGKCPQKNGIVMHPDDWDKQERREITMKVMSNWFRKDSKSGYVHNLERRKLIKKIQAEGWMERKYDANWLRLSRLLLNEILRYRDISDISEYEKNLAVRMEKNRGLLFNLEAFKELYQFNIGYKFPSLKGFVHTAIGYYFVLQGVLNQLEGKSAISIKEALKKMRETAPQTSIRFLVRHVWKESTGGSNDEFTNREVKFLKAQVEKSREQQYEILKNKRPDAVFDDYFMLIEGKLPYSKFDNIDDTYLELDKGKQLDDLKSGRVNGKAIGGVYNPLSKGVRIVLTEKDKMGLQKDTKGEYTVFKSPFDLEDFEKWLELKKLFI